MTPAVSVIVPTFNRAHFVGAAIESVLSQTYTDYELIVVDDGSTDDTSAVVARYHDRARYIRIPHAGVGRARNVGEAAARGQYVLVLDSDDLLYPYALELQARVLDTYPAIAFVCAEMSGFDETGVLERYHLKTYHSSAFRKPAVTYDNIYESSVLLGSSGLLPDSVVSRDASTRLRRAYFGNIFAAYLDDLVIAQNTVMMRRSISSAVGARDESIRHFDVVDHLLRVCRHHRVCFIDVPTYMMRYHSGQASIAVGAQSKVVWLRKQRWLLRVVKRHVYADRRYYERHRRKLNARLAHLHRAVAVPLLVADEPRRASSYVKRARVHLARSWRYGSGDSLLWAITFLPRPLRNVAVAGVGRIRRLSSSRRELSMWRKPQSRELRARELDTAPLPSQTSDGANARTAWWVTAAGMAAVLMLLVAENLGADILNDLLIYLPGVDKVLHVVQSIAIFVVLALLLRRTSLRGWSLYLAAAGGTVVAAVFDEIQQGFAGDRHMELADVGAAIAGILIAYGLLGLRVRRSLAAAAVIVGVISGGSLTYASYLRTRDYNHGLLAEREGRMGDAVRHYRKAVDAGVREAEVFNALAWAMLEAGSGDADGAVAFASQSLAMRPDNPDTLDTYGWALHVAGRSAEAIAPLEAAFRARPDIYCIHYHLGVVYLAVGRREEGILHLRQQMQSMPGTKEARLAAAVLTSIDMSRSTK